jgi:hypothetical protein
VFSIQITCQNAFIPEAEQLCDVCITPYTAWGFINSCKQNFSATNRPLLLLLKQEEVGLHDCGGCLSWLQQQFHLFFPSNEPKVPSYSQSQSYIMTDSQSPIRDLWVSELIYDQQSVGQSVLVSGAQFFFLLEISFRHLRVCKFVAPSLTRGWVCKLLPIFPLLI